MPRFDLSRFKSLLPRERAKRREAAVGEFVVSEGYGAWLDLQERRFRSLFLRFLMAETDDARRELAAEGRAVWKILREDERRLTGARREEERRDFAARMASEMGNDRAEIRELERALYETRLKGTSGGGTNPLHRATDADLEALRG